MRDLMGGRPISSPVLSDPRALFVEMVEYSKDGAVLKGNPRSEANKASALSLALRYRSVSPAPGAAQGQSIPGL
jgi:hypothetical protein